MYLYMGTLKTLFSFGEVNGVPENIELCLTIELKAVWPLFYSYDKRGT